MPSPISLPRRTETIADVQRKAAGVGIGFLGVRHPGAEQHERTVAGVPQVVGLQADGQLPVEENLADAGIHTPIRALQHGTEVAFALIVGIERKNPFAGQTEAVLQGEVDAGTVHAARAPLVYHLEERLHEEDAQLRLPKTDGRGEMSGGSEVLHPLEVGGGEDNHTDSSV